MSLTKRGVFLVIWAAGAAGCLLGQGPYNYRNSYWPMTIGNKWVYRVSSETLQPSDPSVIGAASVFTIQPSPANFGCTVPFNNGENATTPWEVDLTKVYPGAYWQPTLAQHLRWFLGVPPTGQPGAGAIFQLGWIAYDYSNYKSTTDAKNLIPISPTSSVPYGQLVQGPDADQAVKYSNYISPGPDIMSCATGTPQFSGRAWAATWHTLSTMVLPIGTFKNVLEAKYIEQGGGAGTNYEIWYFANELGPIKIVATDANWMELDYHSRVGFMDTWQWHFSAVVGNATGCLDRKGWKTIWPHFQRLG